MMNYTVKNGDTLSGIAQKFGVSVAQLVKLNKIANPNKIYAGQKLTIKPASKPATTPKQAGSYTVKAGDTLSAIAVKFKTTVAQLVALNKIKNPDKIAVGQKIKLPAAKKPAPKPAKKPAATNSGSKPSKKQFVALEQMKQIGWRQIDAANVAMLNECLAKFNITTKKRMAHFIAQCSHESGCGRYRLELASGKSYEGRRDLGNTQPGDGVKFKGAGYIQLTGRSNYAAFSRYVGDSKILSQGAKYVATKYPWLSAGFWWNNNKMNNLCDGNASVAQVTRRVNGGYNHLSERQKYYDRCQKYLK